MRTKKKSEPGKISMDGDGKAIPGETAGQRFGHQFAHDQRSKRSEESPRHRDRFRPFANENGSDWIEGFKTQWRPLR